MSNLVLRPSTFTELVQFSQLAAKTKMVPAAFQGKPEDIMMAVQMGSELGLAPMQAVQSIAVINGRPSVWGDALIGLCRTSPLCEDIAEKVDGEGDAMVATCIAKRKGSSPTVGRFSVADAKKAGLWGKSGPWQQYPQRMLQQRARGFALRDAFPDVLRGLITAEEAGDIPEKAAPYTGTTIDATPEAAPAPAATLPPAARFFRTVADLDAACLADGRQRTAAEWVSAICAELNAAPDGAAVDALHARSDVRKGVEALKNGNLAKLTEALATARARFEALDDPDAERGEYGVPEAAE